MVRAKFVVTEPKEQLWSGASSPIKVVVLSAAQGEENKSWAKWTPSGTITMQIDNPAALEHVECGKAFFVDFSEAPADEADEKK